MRAHTSEHRDALPVLDITALRHIAYVLDGFIYYMRNDMNFYEKNESIPSSSVNANENDDTDDELSNITSDEPYVVGVGGTSANPSGAGSSRRNTFFARSDSTLSLGCLAPDGFDLPLDVAIPLADKPHLLQPNSKRQDLFANLPLIVSPTENTRTVQNNQSSLNTLDNPPTKLGYSLYNMQKASIDETSPAIEVLNSVGDEIDDEIDDNIDQMLKPISADLRFTADTASDSVSGISGNVYLQLKKKKYSDDPKTAGEYQHKKDDDEQMDVDSAGESLENASVQPPIQSDVMAVRPDVIIVPSKTVLNSEGDIVTESNSSGNLTSPSMMRSVIVRAGDLTASIKSHEEPSTSHKANMSYVASDGNAKNATGRTTKLSSFIYPVRGQHFCQKFEANDTSPSWNFLLGRWKLTLDLFGRVFMDDVGMEHGSVLPELRGFPVKEMRFRRHMEKLRNGQQRDLILCKLERNRDSLIMQTFKELNSQFGSQNRRVHPPLTFNRVKVTFKDEPGEGSGVARSFYTSISEALLASSKMPNLESVQVGNNSGKYGVPFSSILRNRGAPGRDPPTLQRRGTGSKILWRTARERKALNYYARPYVSILDSAGNTTSRNSLAM